MHFAHGFGFPSENRRKPRHCTCLNCCVRALMNKLCPTEGCYRLPQPSCLSIPLPFLASWEQNSKGQPSHQLLGVLPPSREGIYVVTVWHLLFHSLSQQQHLPVTLDFRGLNRTYSRGKVIAEMNRL